MIKAHRITNTGERHVVIRRQHFHEMLRRVKVKLSPQLWAELELAGRVIVIDLDTWQRILEIVRRAIRARGGGCSDFCEQACSGDDGCDDAGGSPGECVAVCKNGEVYLENPAP